MTDQNKNILKKIQKLLALANHKTATEGEANNSMAAVKLLLDKHRLSLTDVEALDTKTSEVTHLPFRFKKKSFYKWEQQLMSVVAELLNVDCFINNKSQRDPKSGKYCTFSYPAFIGLPTDVTVALEMYAYLHDTVSALRKTYFKENRTELHERMQYEGISQSTIHDSYMFGIVATLSSRVKELKNAEQAALKQLVVTNQHKIDEYKERELNLRCTRSSAPNVDLSTYGTGKVDGGKVNLKHRNVLK